MDAHWLYQWDHQMAKWMELSIRPVRVFKIWLSYQSKNPEITCSIPCCNFFFFFLMGEEADRVRMKNLNLGLYKSTVIG
jgi:hypothetical protein